MDSIEKKPKRPRISGAVSVSAEGQETRYEKVNYNQGGDYQSAGERRYNSRQGGYNRGGNNYGNNSYNRQGGYNRYNNDNYQPRNNRDYNSMTEGEGEVDGNVHEGYQPRRQQGGYNNRGYNNNRQGGYGNNRQGGYNNGRQQGGNRQGGYGNNRQGGYNNRQQGGGNRQQGGYGNNNRRPNNNRRQQGNDSIMPMRGKSFTPRPKRIEYEMPIMDPNEQMRLN